MTRQLAIDGVGPERPRRRPLSAEEREALAAAMVARLRGEMTEAAHERFVAEVTQRPIRRPTPRGT